MSSQMKDPVRPGRVRDLSKPFLVGKMHDMHAKVVQNIPQTPPACFAPNQEMNFVAVMQKATGQIGPDETRGAGQNAPPLHVFLPIK